MNESKYQYKIIYKKLTIIIVIIIVLTTIWPSLGLMNTIFHISGKQEYNKTQLGWYSPVKKWSSTPTGLV